MPDETRHESADLEDYEVEDASDTLTGDPGDDPLDRGVAPPERWSAGMRSGTTAGEQQAGESLDELLAEEEPDTPSDADDEDPAPTVHISQRAADEEERRDKERVGFYDPLDVRKAGMHVRLQNRQRHVHNGHVGERHGGGEDGRCVASAWPYAWS